MPPLSKDRTQQKLLQQKRRKWVVRIQGLCQGIRQSLEVTKGEISHAPHLRLFFFIPLLSVSPPPPFVSSFPKMLRIKVLESNFGVPNGQISDIVAKISISCNE